MISKLISGIFQSLPRAGLSNQFCSSLNAISTVWNPWSLTIIRNKMRYHFPHANERKRIKKHGWNVRMSTLGGRKIIMRRILKGKHVLSH